MEFYQTSAEKTLSWLVCGFHGACLDSMLPGVHVTAALEFLLHSSYLSDSEDSDSLV